MPCPVPMVRRAPPGCCAPPRRRASQTAICSQPSRSQRSLRPMVDHIVTEVQATITTSTTRGHAAGHRSDVSPIFQCGGLRVSNACQEGGGAVPENVRHNQRGSYWIPGSYTPRKGLKHLILNRFFQGCCISRDPLGKPGKIICYVKLDQLRPWNPT